MSGNYIETKWKMLSRSGELSAKQISIRLPVDLEAQIDNLLSLYPNVTKSQIICDLLSLGVKQISIPNHA